MRTGSLLAVVTAFLTVAGAAADARTSFRLSPEAWKRRCPVIENYEALKARGIYLDAVRARSIYVRHDNDLEVGDVVLDVRVDTSGKVRDMQLVSATSAGLVKPVMSVVSGWRYKPVVVNGVEVCVEMLLEVPVRSNKSNATSPSWGAERRGPGIIHGPRN